MAAKPIGCVGWWLAPHLEEGCFESIGSKISVSGEAVGDGPTTLCVSVEQLTKGSDVAACDLGDQKPILRGCCPFVGTAATRTGGSWG